MRPLAFILPAAILFALVYVLTHAIPWAMAGVTPVATAQLAALSSPTEIAIGFCASYLGFDQFKYKKRLNTLLREFAKDYASTRTLLEYVRKDGRYSEDEKTLLYFLKLIGDPEVARHIEENPTLLEDSKAARGYTGYIVKSLSIGTIDRLSVMFAIVLLCFLCIISAAIQIDGHFGIPHPSERFVPIAGGVIVVLGGLPAALFVLSELVFKRAHYWCGIATLNVARDIAKGIDNIPLPKAAPAKSRNGTSTASQPAPKRPMRQQRKTS